MRRFLILITFLSTLGCTRRPLVDACPAESGESATIGVTVDWSESGIESSESRSDDDYIHRVSFRFFPLDGSTPFDRYLEDNITEGEIYVPIGEYSLVVFNESIYDSYWQGAIEFENSDNYSLFAAYLSDESSTTNPFYETSDSERISASALKLASWSIDRFVVSSEMALATKSGLSDEDIEMLEALNPVTPRPLTCTTTISVDVENLSSAATVYASLSGLSHKVFMASGDTHSTSVTHITQLTLRSWNDSSEQHGTISEERLTFSTPSEEQTHLLTLDIVLVDGSLHSPDEELIFDVSDQILGATTTRYADSDLAASASISLPEVSGDIEVSEWGDSTEITIQ